MQNYIIIEDGKFRAKQLAEIDRSKYKEMEDRKRWKVLRWGSKYLIDFGYDSTSPTSTIVCLDDLQLLQALALVRAAFPLGVK